MPPIAKKSADDNEVQVQDHSDNDDSSGKQGEHLQPPPDRDKSASDSEEQQNYEKMKAEQKKICKSLQHYKMQQDTILMQQRY